MSRRFAEIFPTALKPLNWTNSRNVCTFLEHFLVWFLLSPCNHSPPTHSVSSSAVRTCAACRSACPSCGSDSLRSCHSSPCGGRDRTRHISSSVFSAGPERHPGRRRRGTRSRAPLAGVQSRCTVSEETFLLRVSYTSVGTESPPRPWRIHRLTEAGDRALPSAWA